MTTPQTISILNQDVEDAPVASLIPHPDNPRRGDVDAIEESILANGWYGAVIVQRTTRYILAGNHRWQGATRAGALTVPTIFVDVDDAVARRIVLADNRTGDMASYDQSELAAILSQIQDEAGSITGTGYVDSDLDQILTSLKTIQDEASDTGTNRTKAEKPIQIVIGPYKCKVDADKLAKLFSEIRQSAIDDEAIIAECRRRLKL